MTKDMGREPIFIKMQNIIMSIIEHLVNRKYMVSMKKIVKLKKKSYDKQFK